MFEWDDVKAAANVRKHGVEFQEASQVFDDLNSVAWIDDCEDYGEERWIRVGMSLKGRLLVVVFTERRGAIRIISARKADSYEEDCYFRGEAP